jgi:hypothetical protein
MSTSPQAQSRPRPVERFKPTSGLFLGWAGLVCVAVAVLWVAYAVHSVVGLRVALGAAFFGIVVWATQLRPRATAYPHHLVLRNAVRDTTIPLRRIDEVAVGQSLQVFADDQRHVCIGIGNSLRNELRLQRRRNRDNSPLGQSRWKDFADRANRAAPDQTAMSYQTFVVTRIEQLVEDAKKQPTPEKPQRVRHTWAWPEVAGLVVTGVAFVATFLF